MFDTWEKEVVSTPYAGTSVSQDLFGPATLGWDLSAGNPQTGYAGTNVTHGMLKIGNHHRKTT